MPIIIIIGIFVITKHTFLSQHANERWYTPCQRRCETGMHWVTPSSYPCSYCDCQYHLHLASTLSGTSAIPPLFSLTFSLTLILSWCSSIPPWYSSSPLHTLTPPWVHRPPRQYLPLLSKQDAITPASLSMDPRHAKTNQIRECGGSEHAVLLARHRLLFNFWAHANNNQKDTRQWSFAPTSNH